MSRQRQHRNPGQFSQTCRTCNAPTPYVYQWRLCPRCRTDEWRCYNCGTVDRCACKTRLSGAGRLRPSELVRHIPGRLPGPWPGIAYGAQGDDPLPLTADGRRRNPAVNPPRDAENMLQAFHSRASRKAVRVNQTLPRTLRPRGWAYSIYYNSDKKDPGDPNDRQGIDKHFVHTFDAYEKGHDRKVIVYSASGADCDIDAPTLTAEWPDWIVYLGTTPGWVEDPGDGSKREVRCRPSARLACSAEDGSVLFIVRNNNVVVMTGGDLVTTWRGICG